MLLAPNKTYENEPFELEDDLESAILEVRETLFGEERIYLDIKKKIGSKGKVTNIPDGYLIDLSSTKEPKLYVVENELVKHDPLKHVAVQILEFSLSFETSPQKIKALIKETIMKDEGALEKCVDYANENDFQNIDFLLETMIYGENKFNVLVVIDEISEELETALIKRFKFPVEIVTLQRYCNSKGERIYQFEPFLCDVLAPLITDKRDTSGAAKTIDPSEINTIVVPARKDGFEETFIGENCWHAIRIHASMIPKIKYIAAYQVAPVSAITHLAEVDSIEQWKDSNKYILRFVRPASKIGPIKLVPKGPVKALQNARYTSIDRLREAKTLDDAF
ncbi:MAG TPA: hypothetical protein VMW16_16735 [Sedimentisphaerales bacterium]|nr:hypothetical protein [Sedimentisphaerales bacterium]